MPVIDTLMKKLLKTACVVLSISVALLMIAEISARHLFEHAFRGLPEIYLLLVMWLYMLGASLASANRSHLRISILDMLITRPRARQVYDLVIAAMTLIILLFFVRWAWGLVAWGIKRPQTTPILYLPWLSSMLSIFAASLLTTAYGIRDLIQAVRAVLTHQPLKQQG